MGRRADERAARAERRAERAASEDPRRRTLRIFCIVFVIMSIAQMAVGGLLTTGAGYFTGSTAVSGSSVDNSTIAAAEGLYLVAGGVVSLVTAAFGISYSNRQGSLVCLVVMLVVDLVLAIVTCVMTTAADGVVSVAMAVCCLMLVRMIRREEQTS